MKKFLLVLIAFFCVIFTAAAQESGKFQATQDIPSLHISKGDVVYITKDREDNFSFENVSNGTSFIAWNAGGMGGFKDGYNFAFYKIEGVRGSIKIQWAMSRKYNNFILAEVKIYDCRFVKL